MYGLVTKPLRLPRPSYGNDVNEAIAKKKNPHTPDSRYGIYCETKKQSTRGFEENKG